MNKIILTTESPPFLCVSIGSKGHKNHILELFQNRDVSTLLKNDAICGKPSPRSGWVILPLNETPPKDKVCKQCKKIYYQIL